MVCDSYLLLFFNFACVELGQKQQREWVPVQAMVVRTCPHLFICLRQWPYWGFTFNVPADGVPMNPLCLDADRCTKRHACIFQCAN